MKQKTIIGITGEKAGGKGAAADIIRKKYGGSRLTVSNLLRRTLDILYIEASRNNLTNLALTLKKGFGDEVLMSAMIKEVEKEDTDLVIVDGFRMPEDPQAFRKAFDKNFHLIYVTAKAKIRYERSVARGEKPGESQASFAEFLANEKKPTEAKVGLVGKSADYQVDNNGDYQELEEKMMAIMAKL